MGSSNSNPFSNVSWSNPFGGSVLGKAGGAVQQALGNATQNVSLEKPFGDSTLGQMGGSFQNGTGLKNLQNKAGQVNYFDVTPGGPGEVSKNVDNLPAPAAPDVAPISTYNGAQPSYMDNTSEQNFLNSYAKSLNPNVNYNINAQTSPFANAAVKGAGPVSAGGK